MRRLHAPEKLSEESASLYKAMNDESPLPCALIGGAFLEKAITSLLSKFFVNCETAKTILGDHGFLGEFSRCAHLAYCLGLISKGALTNLKTIGKIRNLFAHSHKPLDFEDAEIKNLCANLLLAKVAQVVTAGDGLGM